MLRVKGYVKNSYKTEEKFCTLYFYIILYPILFCGITLIYNLYNA